MAIIGAIAGIAGAAVSAAGAIQEGQANAKTARYQAAVARNNAIISETNAKYAEKRGAVAEQNKRLETAATIGSTKAIQGASGFTASGDSAEKVRASEAVVGELDAITLRENAAREAYGYRTEGVNYQAQGGLYDMEATNAMRAAKISAIGSIIGGIGSVAGKWGSMQSSSYAETSGYKPFATYTPQPLSSSLGYGQGGIGHA